MPFRQRLITNIPYFVAALLLVFAATPLIVEAQEIGAGMSGIQQILYFIVVGFFGWIMGIAGWLLDHSINTFIINFGTTFGTAGVGEAVDALWVTVRDFFNIIFIFGLVYIGFKMILDSDDSRTRSTLVTLVIAALLVNFSLFITKFVVDFSNILATEVATAGFNQAQGIPGLAGVDLSNREVEIANTFFNLMQIPSTLETNPELVSRESGAGNWGYIFGNAIIYIVGAFVFASGAIMILIRFVALSVYMVLSPFMFIGFVIPGFMNVTRKYWTGFLGRAFFAPVYIVLLYFAAVVLQNTLAAGRGSAQGGGNVTALGSNATAENFAAVLAPFLLTSAFMVAAVMVASKLSNDAASTFDRMAIRGSKRVAGYMPRLGAQYGAYGSGVFAEKGLDLAQRTQLGRLATNNRLFGSSVNDSIRGAAKNAKNAKFGASSSIRERGMRRQALNTKFSSDDAIAAAKGLDLNSTDPTEINLIAKATAATNRISPAALEEMSAKQRKEILPYLKAEKVDKLFESDKLGEAEKDALYTDYKEQIEDFISENGQVTHDGIAKLTKKQVEILGDDFIRENIEYFTEEQFESHIQKSDSLTPQQKASYGKLRKDTFEGYQSAPGGPLQANNFASMFQQVNGITTVGGNQIKTFATDSAGVAKHKKPKEIARLPISVLSDSRAIPYITGSVLEEIVSKKTLSVSDRRVLAARLVTATAAAGGGTTITARPGVPVDPDVIAYLQSSAGQRNYF